MQINILNEQDIFDLSQDVLVSIVKETLNHKEAITGEVSVFLVDDEKISQLHDRYFDDPTPTDCISFPIDKPGAEDSYLGDIFVSTETAKRYAEENKLSSFDEIALYIIHGLLHLLGFDDIEDEDRALMRKAEKSCLDNLALLGLSLRPGAESINHSHA